jgi:outer membrane receptor protein involved in Fe transport
MDFVRWRTHVQAKRNSVARCEHDIPVHGDRTGRVRLRRSTLAISIAVAMTAATAAVAAPVGGQAAPTSASQSGINHAPITSDYEIPAGPLDAALNTFAAQAGVHVDYSTGLVAGKTSRGLSGRYAPADALHALLRGTGLGVRSIDSATFVLQPEQAGGTIDPPQALSPPPPKPRTLQTVEVTGSHIRAAELATANPVVTVSAQQIQQTGDLTIGQVIQNLPAVTGPVGSSNIDNGGSRGQTELGLRGLGASRTLVLLNGHRIINNDLNVVPAAAVERVEVMTSGASSVYGSDAIGGVINVILKSNYQGAQFQASYGISDRGDGVRKGFSFVFGQTSDKGSILAGVDYNKEDAISQLSRKFSRQTLSITGSTDTPIHVIPGGSSFTPGSVTFLPQSLQGPFGCNAVTLNTGAEGQSQPLTPSDFHCTTRTDYFSYSAYRPLTQPQERADAFLSGTYHLTSNVDAFLTVLHNKTDSSFTLGPPVWASLTGTVISQYSYYNPFGVTFSPTSGNRFNSRLTTIGNRVTPIGRTQDDVMIGLRGVMTLLDHDWQWEVGYDYGHLSSVNQAKGLPILSKLNPGLGPSMLDPATGQVVCVDTPGDLTTIIPGCVPWDTFNLNNPASLQVVQAPGTTATGVSNTYSQERVKYADISGGLLDLPAGTVQLALGASYRSEYLNSIVGSGILADENGLCPLSSQCTSPVQGGYDVKEIYGELFVPLLKDLPGVYQASLDLGERYSKYSDFGSTSNWKVGLEYRPIEDLLLRGNVSRVFRAPTIGDIFAGIGFGGETLGSDPCDHITVANPACVGVPTNGTFVNDAVANHIQVSVLGSGSALASFPLGPENGKSYDFGVVWSPGFVPGLSVSTDLWRIYLDNEITGVSGKTVLTGCFNGIDKFCPLIERFGADTNSPGQIREIRLPTVNLGRIDVKGVDFNVTYRLPHFSFGQFNVALHATYMTQYKEQTAPGLPGNQVYDLVGNINTDLGGGIGILMPRVRALGTLNWQLGPWSARWQTRFVDHFDLGSNVVSRGYSAIRGFAVPYVLHYGSYVYNDFAVGYDIQPINTRIDFGVNNVFDKQPPFLYYNDTGLGNGGADGADFDVLGRYYWARAIVDF